MKQFPLYFALFLFIGMAAMAQRIPPEGILLDSYAAVVNGKVITVGEILSATQPMQAELMKKYKGAELERMLTAEFDHARDVLVDNELILIDFQTLGGDIPDRAVEDHINTVIHDRFNNDRAAFMEALASERLTLEEWRDKMKDQLIIQVMRQREINSKVVVTPADILQEYNAHIDEFTTPEQVYLRMIVIGKGRTPEEQDARLARAIRIRDRLDLGVGPFGRAARLLSEAANAGDEGAVGWLEVNSLAPEFAEAIRNTSDTGIAPVVTIGDEHYILKVEDRRPAVSRPMEEVYDTLERGLRQKEAERLASIWLASLRSKYNVQIFEHGIFK